MTKRQWMIVAAAILGSSIVMLGESVTNLALPSIARTFGVPFSSLQWVVDGYNLTVSALILLGGSLGDLFGLRRIYLWSIAGFLLISLVCAFAWSAPTLIWMRAVLGISGALLTPVSLALLNAQLPRNLRGRAVGYWTAATSIVLALGPLVGGYLVDTFSWRAIFLCNVPLALLGLLLGYLALDAHTPKTHPKVDWVGAVLGFVSLAGLTYGLIEGPAQGWSMATVGAIVVGAIFFGLFVWFERWGTRFPLVDLSLFRNRNFAATNAATLLLYAAFAGFGFVFAYFLQTKAGYSSTAAGAAFLPSSILLAFFSGKVGEYSTKFGARYFMSVGPVLCALGMLLLLPLSAHTGYLLGILPGVLVFSIGLLLTVTPLTATALGSAPEAKSGVASAINNGVASVGPLILIALFGLFGAAHTYVFAVILCVVLAALAGAISFAFVRKPAAA